MSAFERIAREAYDRKNPWRLISEAKPGPAICELRTNDMVGLTDFGRARFILHDDGEWYRIEPPERIWKDRLVEYRPTGTQLSLSRIRSVVHRAKQGKYEYRGGVLYRKPKAYKLYWRADD